MEYLQKLKKQIIMTIEQKAQRYNESLKRAKKLYEQGTITESLSYVFPELKESEDERIRKAMIDFFKHEREEGITVLHYGVNIECMIAWLEKQGNKSVNIDIESIVSLYKQRLKSQGVIENTHLVNMCLTSFRRGVEIVLEKLNLNGLKKQDEQTSDKVEPKFKNGQWVVWQDKCYKVNYNGCGYELVDQDGLSTSLEYRTIDENAHIWDVTTDAKDGDVLAFYSEYKGNKMVQFGIIEKYIGRHGGCSNSFKTYVGVNWDNNLQLGKYMGCSDIHPATKEQRDQLEKAITNAGYRWNPDEKKIEKIEQKPDTDFSDLRKWKYIVDAVLTEREGIGQYIDSPWTTEVAEKLQKRFGSIEQKPAWSEEDY